MAQTSLDDFVGSGSRWEAIASGRDRSLAAGTLRAVGRALEPGYRMIVGLRNSAFDRGWRKVHKLPRPVISVGNITVGGTGKTPMVVELCRRVQAMGHRPAVLLRGYKGAGGGSDEAAVLRGELGSQVPVGVNADRAKAADAVLAKAPHVSLFILDDGFQHRRVYRDVNIVLINAACPFGLGHMLPRGLLREPPEALRRADAVVVTHADEVPAQARADLDNRIHAFSGKPPLGHIGHSWAAVRDAQNHEHPVQLLGKAAVLGVCGIGSPGSFIRALRRNAGRVVGERMLGDHHRYNARELTVLLKEAREAGAAVVLTEKDWVKWRVLLPTGPAAAGLPPIYRPRLELGWMDGSEAIADLIRRRLPATTTTANA